jgi:hypothetical protein
VTRITSIFRTTLLFLIAFCFCNQLTASVLSSFQASQPNVGVYLNLDSARFWTQDKFEGTLENTISLNEYIYANADGENLIDPSGFETLTELLAAEGIDQNNEKIQTPAGLRAYQKATKTVVCQAGRLTFEGVLVATGGHHVWPKFMGGPKLQNLAKLPVDVHVILHKLIYLIAKNDPLLAELSALGGPNGSEAAWDKVMSTPQGRAAAFRALRLATGMIDKWCGFIPPATLTNELETMLKAP